MTTSLLYPFLAVAGIALIAGVVVGALVRRLEDARRHNRILRQVMEHLDKRAN